MIVLAAEIESLLVRVLVDTDLKADGLVLVGDLFSVDFIIRRPLNAAFE